MTSLPSLDEEERWVDAALVTYAETRDPGLKVEIVERTLWLAQRAARRFTDRGEPYDDLVQVARLGLLKAIDRFDPSHGVPFGAFATPTIVGEVRRHFRDHTWSVHVSRRAKDVRPAVNNAADDLAKELGRSPTVDEIAARINVSVDVVLEALEANNAYRTAPLDATGDAQHRNSETSADLDNVLDREVLATVMGRLQPRERRILHLRFFEELSQAQIAELIGTSQVHVGRLITSSLARLRTYLGAGHADAELEAGTVGPPPVS